MVFLSRYLARLPGLLRALHDYLGAGRHGRMNAIADGAALARFIDSRASHVTQISLYGYLRTRAGTRYPELFSSDVFAAAINGAKWNLWLACVSDLAVYAGGLIAARTTLSSDAVRVLVSAAVDSILEAHGIPEDADDSFPGGADALRRRIALTDFTAVEDGEGAFSESPAALVRFAPVVDEFKQLDAEIVMNSVRFRWPEIRQALRRDLDATAIVAEAEGAT